MLFADQRSCVGTMQKLRGALGPEDPDCSLPPDTSAAGHVQGCEWEVVYDQVSHSGIRVQSHS